MNLYLAIASLMFFANVSFAVGKDCGGRKKYVQPSELYGQLFYDVMSNDSLFGPHRMFIESKSFVDAVPKYDAATIRKHYDLSPNTPMADFIKAHFIIVSDTAVVCPKAGNGINRHIKSLWQCLSRGRDSLHGGSRIAMRHPYFVPGGRFREMYYWDTYFSMLGMLSDGEDSLVMNILCNFADAINEVGFIPNGMRSYYIGRSQPPFFSFMVEDAAMRFGDGFYVRFLPEMLKEHQFWMDGADSLRCSLAAFRRVVRMPDGELLNRYYDDYATPRDEAYRNDVATGKKFLEERPSGDVARLYRDLRAAAESGFDFSSRWMADGKNLSSIRTTGIVPVDLNCLMFHLEQSIAKASLITGDSVAASRYQSLAGRRREAILKYCWSEKDYFFKDYVLDESQQSPFVSLAGAYPLFCGIADAKQARSVCNTIKYVFLKAGGCVTTPYHTGQQWDAPNGWAPLQWIVFKGLKNYGFDSVASDLRRRWMATVEKVFRKEGNIKEKYDVERQSDTAGGEYANQIGFGWTNGVYRAMASE